MKIYIKHTTQSSFANSSINWATETSGAALVYSNTTQNFMPAIGWQEFTLSTPFVWNGTDNLEIFVDWMQPSSATVSLGWQFSSYPQTSALSSGATTPSIISRTGFRPNIQLAFMSNTVVDAGISAIAAPVSPVLPGVSRPVQVVLRNFGGTALTSATVNWSVNGAMQPSFAWSGSLAPATSTAPLTIGTFNFPAGNQNLCAWTGSPNGGTDFNSANDSSCVTLAACAPLAGHYTIDTGAPVSATNFQSFTAAVKQLTYCGVSGAVIFTAAPGSGPYTGHLAVTAIPGGVPDSVVFNGNGVTLSATNSAPGQAVILLDGAKRIIFRNLNLHVSATTLSANYGFQLINNANSCTIANCNITLPGTAAYGIFAGLPGTATGSFTSYSTFKNNTITGGSNGIRLESVSASPATGNSVLNNQLLNFSNSGIYLQDQRKAVVHGNELSRPVYTGSGNFYGITLDRGTEQNIISANRLHQAYGGNVTGTAQCIGIQLLASNAPVGLENIIKNNLIYNINTTGTRMGLYNSASSGAHYFHNTLYFQHPTPTTGRTEAFSQSNAATNIRFSNNIISLNMNGGAKHYALYFNAPASVIVSNNNVISLGPNAAGLQFTGYSGGSDYATLAQWQAVPGGPYDAASLAVDPTFANVSAGNLRPTNPLLRAMGLPLVQVPEDINGFPRNPNGPDPGAYEFTTNTGQAENHLAALPLKVFPNPFSQGVTVQVNAAQPGELRLVLLDGLGRTMARKTVKVAAGMQVLAPEIPATLAPGFYVLQLELNGRKTQQKLLKH